QTPRMGLTRRSNGVSRTAPVVPPAVARSAQLWLVGFIAVQIVCQLALLLPSLGSMRVVFRMVPFLSSLALLAILPPGGPRHRAFPWAIAVIGILIVQIFRGDSYSELVSIAHTVLYLAILAPIFWGPRLALGPRSFYVMILILWGFHT